jgi:Zn-dependent peptidase ImmA (M78 family)
MRYTKEQIHKSVEQLLKQAGVTKPPVPVERIARLRGAEVRYVSFQGDISGLVALEGGQPLIGVNMLHSKPRQRFTIAHELGHLELGHLEGSGEHSMRIDRDFKVMLRDNNSSPAEREANAYAAALLMPTSLLIKERELTGGIDTEDDRLIHLLASRYKVSTQAMTIRLANLANLLSLGLKTRFQQDKKAVSRKKWRADSNTGSHHFHGECFNSAEILFMSPLLISNPDTASDDLVERGQNTYRQRLASVLEPSRLGEFVAIEPESGRYFLGSTATAALVAARSAMPNNLFYLTRVGRETAHTFGGHATRIR